MMLAVSSPMIPADSLTAKAELLKSLGLRRPRRVSAAGGLERRGTS